MCDSGKRIRACDEVTSLLKQHGDTSVRVKRQITVCADVRLSKSGVASGQGMFGLFCLLLFF